MSYVPSDNRIKELENTDLSTLTASEQLRAIEDVEWMLQTDSYSKIYLERLLVLEKDLYKVSGGGDEGNSNTGQVLWFGIDKRFKYLPLLFFSI